jgi:hypothetical protein
MTCENAESLLFQVERAFVDIEELIKKQPEIEGYLAKYLTVFTCGIYEESIEAIVKEMVGKLGSTELSNFVENNLKFFRNPKINTICEFLNKFNSKWGHEIDSMTEDSKNALDGIVNNKNDIAHGAPCSITFSDIKEYYHKSLPIIKKIDLLLL